VLTVDEAAWAEAVGALAQLQQDHPEWTVMVTRGVLVATAYQSPALDGLYPADPEVGLALLRGEPAFASVGDIAGPHLRANFEALLVAIGTGVSEDGIRRIHEVACRPQLHHPVEVDGHLQDHVLAAGDYKHHPNHVRTADGGWRATAPVAQLESEMAQIVATANSPEFAGLHLAVQAAYLNHALLHVQPFADGNGRVGRALAGAILLRSGCPPVYLMADDVDAYLDARTPAETVAVVQRAVSGVARTLASFDHDGPLVTRWRKQEAAGRALQEKLAAGVVAALKRHAADPSRRADLSGAAVELGAAITIRVPSAGVEEVITVDAHPLDDGALTAMAREAGLRFKSRAKIAPWLDRVVSTLALRTAAELE
jgi:hypothetical protein